MSYCIVSKGDSLSDEIVNVLKKMIKTEYDENNPKLVVSVGGDGTILKAIHKYADMVDNVVIIGVNTGHLGFITNFTVEELSKVADIINSDKYETESVSLLDYEVETADGVTKGIALNEVTVVNPPRTLIVDVIINDNELEKFRGTGLCVSSPFGSTAYNKSLHGCVVDPSVNAFQVTEVASINSKAYRTLGSPILLGEDKTVTIKADNYIETWVTVDNLSYQLSNFKSVKCRLSKHKVKFAQNNILFIDRLKKAFVNN